MKKTLVFLLLGTNLGKREENLRQAIVEIEKEEIFSLKLSSIYQSESWGFESDNYFLNQCVSFTTHLKAEKLLTQMQQIEEKMGRVNSDASGYEDRLIDIDILLFGNEIVELEKLVVPHPRMTERKFTLIPLAELAPKLIHPVFLMPISELLTICTDHTSVIKL